MAENQDRYKWVALTNTTAAVFMSALDSTPQVFNTATRTRKEPS